MNLKSYIKSNDIQVTEFADLIGVKRNIVHRYLNGSSIPSRETARKIEEVTGGQVKARELRRLDDYLQDA
jgi:DNA-binding transcriptional regulator YdaS (Cro superfamily)